MVFRMRSKGLADRAIEVRNLIESGEAAGLRTRHRLSLETGARTIGVSATALYRWERGERWPQGRNLIAYHKFLSKLAEGA